MKRRKNPNALPEGGFRGPFRHENHPRPITRRQLLGAGFLSGPAIVVGPAWLAALLKVRPANAALDADINSLATDCKVSAANPNGMGSKGPLPFITIDLAGGANLMGSEAIAGLQGGQMNLISSAGFAKLGIPGNMVPTSSAFTDASLGLMFHSDSAILRGIKTRATTATLAGVNGVVMPAISQNDTGNDTLNAMYAIAKAAMYGPGGTNPVTYGSLITLCGTQSSVSGGNSMSPANFIDPTLQPTKIAQASDDTGLVSTGTTAVNPDTVKALQSQARISAGTTAMNSTNASGTFNSTYPRTNPTTDVPSMLAGMTLVPGNTAADQALKDQVRCAYVKSASTADQFGSPSALNPSLDTNIVGASGAIFTTAEYNASSNFQKAGAVMKLVMNGFAGAGTIALGGYDYHDSTRATGETANFNAGVIIGAIMDYARRVSTPVMIHIISDGSLVSTGNVDSSAAGRNKLGWQGDNQQVAASILLLYSPKGRPALTSASANQIGYLNSDGTVNATSSPGANANNLLVQTVMLNYMAAQGQQGQFGNVFTAANLGTQGLGSAMAQAAITSFTQVT